MAYKCIESEWNEDCGGLDCKFICDSVEDIADLPACNSGSVAVVVAEGSPVHVVNASGEWKEISSANGGGSGGASDCDWEIMKNKPFGEAEKIVIFEENSISDAYIGVDRDLFGYPAVETCTVVFDGEKYVGSVYIYWDDMSYTDVINISFTLADGTKYVLTSGNDYSSFDDGSHTLEIYIGGEVVPLDEKYIQLTSPNGTKYKLTVSDDGTITAVVVE